MTTKDDDFQKKLLGTFKIEAQDHIRALSSGLIELEKAADPDKQKEIIESVFREAHSFKGAARSINMMEIESLCRSLEDVFAALKRQEILPSSQLMDVLHPAVNSLSELLDRADTERTPEEKRFIKELISRLENVVRIGRAETGEREKEAAPPNSIIGSFTSNISDKAKTKTGTVRISEERLESLLLQAEELLSIKKMSGQRASEIREIQALTDRWHKEWAKVSPEVLRIRQLLEKDGDFSRDKAGVRWTKQLEFLEWSQTFMKSLGSRMKALAAEAGNDNHSTDRMVDDLLENMRKAAMLPFSTLLEAFPLAVRSLCRDRGKKAELVVRGADMEVDRRILEEMKVPLIHLLRNCIDHGIEKPEEREKRNKPPSGLVTLAILERDGGHVAIEVADDGAGIDVTEVKTSALRLGLFSRDEMDKMNRTQTLSLVYQSGVTTSPIITDVSGRGLGLAIVREKVDGLGGMISVETAPGRGTTFRIVLPLNLATFRGILLRAADQMFVIPSGRVERVVRIKKDDVKTVENQDVIGLDGKAVSLVRMHDVLGSLPSAVKAGDSGFIFALVIGAAENRIAFRIDEILDEQEFLIKSLGKQISRAANLAGATLLPGGELVPVLNVSDLMRNAVRLPSRLSEAPAAMERIESEKKSVLVVEDSITARMLLKSILESAGYQVKTAVDGIDAFTLLRTEDFDAMVSDVDMPRMNGFDLTAKVRADKKLSELPVVLVTALESREDRERGIDVGANAYIVKSSFDQSNLLEVIGRLV